MGIREWLERIGIGFPKSAPPRSPDDPEMIMLQRRVEEVERRAGVPRYRSAPDRLLEAELEMLRGRRDGWGRQ